MMKIDWIKYLLLAGMAATAILLLKEWVAFEDKRAPEPAAQTTLATPETEQELDPSGEVPDLVQDKPQPAKQKLIHIATDSLNLKVDTRGGDIVYVSLPRHLAELNATNKPLILLNQTADHTYVAQSGLVGSNGTDKSGERPVFTTSQNSYQLQEGENELVVDLLFQQGGVSITKRYTFTRGSYLVDLRYLVDNRTDADWSANLWAQIKRDSQTVATDVGIGMNPYLGAALTTTEEKYKKLDFEDIADAGTVKESVQGGWIAMVQHYFISAWIPAPDSINNFSLRKASNSDLYFLGFTTPAIQVAPGQQGEIGARFYAGPKDVQTLEAISPYLDLTVDYGWLWWIAKPLFSVLHFIYSFIGNWGFAIIVLTIIIKLIFFPLSAASYKSMARMRKLGPLMQDLKERYGDDRQKMSAELMKLYKKEKINPMGGCLPVLVQMPVFIALYWVLMESVELRHTPFLGWIDDLSVMDPYFILPVIMGISMFVQFKLNPTPPDPTQAKVMQMMPLFMTFMFLWFPAGLVLYWVCNNIISIAQQYVITRQIEAGEKA